MDTYETFTKYFTKKGGTKRNSKEDSEVKTFLDEKDGTLKIMTTDNAQQTFKDEYVTTADMIDIAEII